MLEQVYESIEGILTPTNALFVLEDPIFVSRLVSMLQQTPPQDELGLSERYIRVLEFLGNLFD